jgi:hypothetical protein
MMDKLGKIFFLSIIGLNERDQSKTPKDSRKVGDIARKVLLVMLLH